ncbi:MAG: hypothetical protein MR300_00595 [Ruminococcus sp.]|nr:hypothetical protein [Ruminococcus sp.]
MMKKVLKYTAIFLLNFFMSFIYWFWQLVMSFATGLGDFTYSSKEAYIYAPARSYYMMYLILVFYIIIVVLINVCILNGWLRKKYEIDIMKYTVLAILGFNILFIMWFAQYILAVCFNIY